MKKRRFLLTFGAPLFLAAGLAGCAMPGHHVHMDHGSSHDMDMAAMCDMHKKEMAGKTAAEQQALMQEHMKSMSPEMRQRMQEMHARCQ
jgi:hypothetical protein